MTTFEPDNGATIRVGLVPAVRFWDVPTPAIVIARCQGRPLLLATWVAITALLREAQGLQRPDPDHAAIAAYLDLDVQIIPAMIQALAVNGLIQQRHGRLTIPWLDLCEASLAAASAKMDAAGITAQTTLSDPPATQSLLPGLS